jgi:hypothetical protein
LSENLNSAQHAEEFEMSMRVHANIEKLKKANPDLFVIDGPMQPDLGGWLIGDPYLTWNIASEKVLATIMN